MKFFAKYGIGLYIVVSFILKIHFLVPKEFTYLIFYGLMISGIVLIPFHLNTLFHKKILNAFWLFYFITLLNIVHLVVFTPFNQEAWLYFFSKYATFNLIILGLTHNYSFYERWIVKYLKYFYVVLVIIGYFFGSDLLVSDRLSMGYNANDVGLFGLMGFFLIVYLNKTWYKSKIDLPLVIFFISVSLLSGSRASLIGILIAIFLYAGLSFRTVSFALLFYISLQIIGSFNENITGINRLTGNNELLDTREDVFDAGLLTFKDAFWFGNGIDKYGWANPKYFENPDLAMGPHSTYLSLGIMYGTIFAVLFVLALLIFLFQNRFNKRFYYFTQFEKFSYYFLIIFMVIGFVESLIVGINEIVTILFFFYVGVISVSRINKTNS